MTKKEKGPAARKPTGPKQAAKKVARILNSKIKELESQDGKLLLAFAKIQDATELTEPAVNMMCRFLLWLRKNDYIILDAKRMVRLSLELG